MRRYFAVILMINSIELINWKTHGSTKLSFSKGTNILIGQMGAGKSSIMDAISFGLFGTFPAVKNRRVSVNGLIRNRPDQKKNARVKISFNVGEDTYLIEREVTLDESAKATLQKNGTYVQSQPQRVTEEIEKALMMDYDLFARAIYSEQNRLDYFLELRSSERKKQIDNLLGLDKFANAQENTTSLVNKIKETIEESRKTAESFDIEGQKGQKAKLEEEKEKVTAEKNEIMRSIDKLKEKRGVSEASLKRMKDDYNRKNTITREMAEMKSKILVLTDEIEKINSEKLGELMEVEKTLKSTNARSSELAKKLKDNMAIMQNAQTTLGKKQSELATISKDIVERDKLLASIKGKEKSKVGEELEKCRKRIEETGVEIASMTAQKNEADKWIRELEKHISKCPVCERDLDSRMKEELLTVKKKLVKEFGDKAKVLQEAQKKEREEINELNLLFNKLVVVEERVKGYSNLEEKRTITEKELEKAIEESSRIKKGMDKLNEEINKVNEELSKFKSAKSALERKEMHLSERKKAEENVAKKQKEIDGIKVDEKKLEIVQKEFTELSSGISRNEASLEGVGKALEEKARQIDEKKKEIEKIEKLYTEISSKKTVIDNLVKFNNSLQETQAHLRSRLVSSINRIMQDIWPELYPYGDYPGLELNATEGDYVLRICTYRGDKETWEDVDEIASGGERSIACLAMRVAFALVLVPNLKWLILDEPTHNIDQQGIGRFVSVFNEKLPKIVEQIFIITHDEQLKQVSNGKVYMFSRNKGENGETVAEEL
jgi:exonuclease SbcC